MEELLEKQQRERKDLRDHCSQLLKDAKADKKNKNAKKEARTEMERMERDLKERHEEEVKKMEIGESTEKAQDELVQWSKSQKRRMRKEERLKQQRAEAELEASLMVNEKQIELDALFEKLSAEQLHIVDIPADGHCLFRAIEHQLQQINAEDKTFKDLREIAGRYIASHAEEFIGFIEHEESGDILLTPNDITEYAQRISNVDPVVWGGQAEILAIAKSLDRKIIVYSANSPDLVMEGNSLPPIRISFHQHSYGLGPHYNSVL